MIGENDLDKVKEVPTDKTPLKEIVLDEQLAFELHSSQ